MAARARTGIPRLIADIRSGRINVRDQVSAVWPIDRIEEAIAALKAGEVTRAVLDHDR
jgi:S-(hydroxymethyl)glutathione dehydrogenase / alcohol dehydrogenase